MALRGVFCFLLCISSFALLAQRTPSMSTPPVSSAPAPQEEPQTSAAPLPPVATYNKSIFQGLIPSAELAFLKQYDGATTHDLARDKQFKHLLKQGVPGWEFHYSRDMSLPDALALALDDSRLPVAIRDGRYLTAAGQATGFAPHPEGRGFLWIDISRTASFWARSGSIRATASPRRQ